MRSIDHKHPKGTKYTPEELKIRRDRWYATVASGYGSSGPVDLAASEPAPDVRLGDDTTRVIVHLFRAAEQEDRDVGTMARFLKMEQGALKYHLEQLEAAGLAKMIGLNYLQGHIYWGLTPEGRRHVVERKLI
jgi:DNA-binding HxlR family transcriptional regulator